MPKLKGALGALRNFFNPADAAPSPRVPNEVPRPLFTFRVEPEPDFKPPVVLPSEVPEQAVRGDMGALRQLATAYPEANTPADLIEKATQAQLDRRQMLRGMGSAAAQLVMPSPLKLITQLPTEPMVDQLSISPDVWRGVAKRVRQFSNDPTKFYSKFIHSGQGNPDSEFEAFNNRLLNNELESQDVSGLRQALLRNVSFTVPEERRLMEQQLTPELMTDLIYMSDTIGPDALHSTRDKDIWQSIMPSNALIEGPTGHAINPAALESGLTEMGLARLSGFGDNEWDALVSGLDPRGDWAARVADAFERMEVDKYLPQLTPELQDRLMKAWGWADDWRDLFDVPIKGVE